MIPSTTRASHAYSNDGCSVTAQTGLTLQSFPTNKTLNTGPPAPLLLSLWILERGRHTSGCRKIALRRIYLLFPVCTWTNPPVIQYDQWRVLFTLHCCGGFAFFNIRLRRENSIRIHFCYLLFRRLHAGVVLGADVLQWTNGKPSLTAFPPLLILHVLSSSFQSTPRFSLGP